MAVRIRSVVSSFNTNSIITDLTIKLPALVSDPVTSLAGQSCVQQAWYVFHARKTSCGDGGNQDDFEQLGAVSIVDGWCNSNACNRVYNENYDPQISDRLSPNKGLYSRIGTTSIRIKSILSRGNVYLYITMYELDASILFGGRFPERIGRTHLVFQQYWWGLSSSNFHRQSGEIS